MCFILLRSKKEAFQTSASTRRARRSDAATLD